MKSPDDVKKGLRCLSRDRTHTLPCSGCEYHGQGLPPCRTAVHEDAIALIQQLQHNNAQLAIDKAKLAAENAEQADRIKQLEAERDAVMESIRSDPHCCYHCANMTKRGICQSEPRADGQCFEWRGVQKEE